MEQSALSRTAEDDSYSMSALEFWNKEEAKTTEVGLCPLPCWDERETEQGQNWDLCCFPFTLEVGSRSLE